MDGPLDGQPETVTNSTTVKAQACQVLSVLVSIGKAGPDGAELHELWLLHEVNGGLGLGRSDWVRLGHCCLFLRTFP